MLLPVVSHRRPEFRVPAGAVLELQGPGFEHALFDLMGPRWKDRTAIIAPQPPCPYMISGSVEYKGCVFCGSVVLLTPQSLSMINERSAVAVCIECAWTLTVAMRERRHGRLC